MKNVYIKTLLVLAVVSGIALAIMFRDLVDLTVLEQWTKGAGIAGPVVFMFIYALATIFFFPGSVLTLAGGVLFGPVWGTLYNLTGATLGALLAFLIARYLASDWVENKSSGRIQQLKQGVEGEGWRFVALVRLLPLFPFNLLNYALGLTKLKVFHYVVASYIFMLPGAIAYTYLGYAGREAIAGGDDMIQKILLAISLLAVVAFIPRLIGRLRQKPMLMIDELKQRLEKQPDLLLLDVRGAEDFVGEQGHIDGAVNVPLEELEKQVPQFSEYQERPIVTICRTDRRSNQAARILARMGFADVHVAKNGMTAWIEAGLPVSR